MVRVSKMLSLTLRHDPGQVGVQLDGGGWVDIDVLLEAFARHGMAVSREELDDIVEQSDKQRFAIANHRIRANQGHSIDVDLGLEPALPPELLFHGTAESSVESILATGINPGQRRQVHLSLDAETARKVGARHGRPVVLTVRAEAMAEAGLEFFRSANGVWLVDEVPAKFVRR
ncbi:putative RNA 2'-phosphotransferase [Leifsonia sp. CL147]|nr:RNA 2'-phosphotransferase [Leifsonia sp. CL154]SEI08905.1 putative RNA 2'-phosphotransferase [Leifsonia sp. CL154]SFL83815.1 putative RNA 2'-phosphotransferase [Leifsonia sp. CL147]